MKPKSKRRLGLWLIAVGLLLTAAGIALGGYNLWDNRRAGEQAENVMESIAYYRDPTAETDAQTETEDGPEPADEADDAVIPDYLLDPLMDMPTVEIDGYNYIGTLSIPVLELELPVMEDWDYTKLRIAPCRYAGSAYRDDLIVCAHNYATHFGRLNNLLEGDEVFFTDMDGNVFAYAVAEVETLAPTAIEEMESGDWELTLFTCTLGGQTRVTVRCHSLENYI